ncbi:T9SS type A sorting domain-containing protein, partial [bacterium]|nr:T9SS type A sorting domain-containing protein [bacterium]
VQFSDSSTGIITEWSWDFGDGHVSSEQNPQHTYEIANTFTVSLTITGPGGSDTETREAYITVTHPSDVQKSDSAIPTRFALDQNFPNPFNPSTRIRYHVKNPCRVRLMVYNVNGQIVQTLVDSYQQAGIYETLFHFDHLPSGIYFYKIHMDDYNSIKKMVKVD